MSNVKAGLIHDYDLMANAEPSAQQRNTCVVCEVYPVAYQWGDYSGEAMCCNCGCPYQLKWGSDQQTSEGKYPYLNLRDDFIPVAREYWNYAKQFVHYGTSFNLRDGMDGLTEWLKKHHPEQLTDRTTGQMNKDRS